MDPLSSIKILKNKAQQCGVHDAAELTNIDEGPDISKIPKTEPEAVFVPGCPSSLMMSLDNIKNEVEPIETTNDDQMLDNHLHQFESRAKLGNSQPRSLYADCDHVAAHVKMENETADEEITGDVHLGEGAHECFIKQEEPDTNIKQDHTATDESNSAIDSEPNQKHKEAINTTSPSKKRQRYKCTKCPFRSPYEKDLRLHMGCHNSSKIEKHKCAECAFETYWKTAFNRHTLRHKNPEDVKMYRCTECDFKTLQKTHLKTHALRHKAPQEVSNSMFKCTECNFQTLWKSYLKRHYIRHLNPEKLDVLKCSECTYETFDKSYLKKHILRHRNPKAMHKCSECSYYTAKKGNLKLHSLRHMNRDEVTMYRCSVCDYNSIHKGAVKVHSLRHHGKLKDANMLKCSKCDTEKDEGGMYKCFVCGYQSLRKNNLNVHILRHHGNPKHIDRYKCFECGCQILQQDSLSQASGEDSLSRTLEQDSSSQSDSLFETLQQNSLSRTLQEGVGTEN